MSDMSESAQVIAEDLYQRFRLLAMVIDRVDSFVGMTPAGIPTENHSDMQAPASWLKSLAENQEEIRAIADDMVLRAFRTGLEPVNFTILLRLQEYPAVSFSELMQATQLNRFSLTERVNDLIQVGLAGKEVQADRVLGTRAAEILVKFIQQVQDRFFNLVTQRLSELTGK